MEKACGMRVRAAGVRVERLSWTGRLCSALGTAASVGVAFFPKCPMCWAAYMSVAGMGGVEMAAYSGWVKGVLIAAMVVNVGVMWMRRRAAGMLGFYLASLGALAVVVLGVGLNVPYAIGCGVVLTGAGSLWGIVRRRERGCGCRAELAGI